MVATPGDILLPANCYLILKLSGGPKDNSAINFSYNEENDIIKV